jgi:hypothetical protein
MQVIPEEKSLDILNRNSILHVAYYISNKIYVKRKTSKTKEESSKKKHCEYT